MPNNTIAFGKESDVIENPIDFGGVTETTRSDKGIKEKVAQAQFVDPTINTDIASDAYKNGEDNTLDIKVGSEVERRKLDAKKSILEEAATKGDSESLDLMQGVLQLPNEDYTKNAVVKEYGRKVAETIALDSFTIDEAISQAPEIGYSSIDSLQDWTSKASIVRDIIDQTKKSYEDKTWFGKGLSIAGTIIPFADWWARHNAINDAPTVSMLPGNNLQEQISYLWSLPVDEIGDTLKEAIDEASTFSDLGGLLFAEAFMQYSSSDQFIDNAFGIVDILAVTPIGKLGKTARGVATTTRSAAKAVIEEGANAAKISGRLGDTVKAATETAVKKGTLTKGIHTAEDLGDTLHTIFNPEAVFKGTKNLSGESYRKLIDASTKRGALVSKTIEHGINDISILNDYERGVIAKDVLEDIRKVHPNIKDTQIDHVIIPAEKTPNNVDTLRIVFGKSNGDTFATEKSAKAWASRNLQFKDAEIVQEGDRWVVQKDLSIPAGERLENIKLSTDSQTPDRNWWGRRFYSDSYKLSKDQILDRRSVSDFGEKINQAASNLAEPINRLSRKSKRQVEDVLEYVRDRIYEDGKRRWLDLQEFEDQFKAMHNRYPTEDQVGAYIAARQINDLDYVLRDLSLMKKKMHLGVEHWTIPGVKEPFEGVQKKTIPWGSEDYFRVTALDPEGKVVATATNISRDVKRAEIDKMIDEGWTLVQGFNGSIIHGKNSRTTFILSKVPERRAISFGNSVGYNPGGHLISKYPYYIKQATLRVGSSGAKQYTGDRTIWNVMTQEEGNKIVSILEEARKLKVAKKENEFSTFVRDNLPELTEKDIKRIDWNVPFATTRSGQRSIDTGAYVKGRDYNMDLVNNQFNLEGQISGRFLGERDSTVVDAIYSEQNSVTHIEKARLLRPYEAMTAGIRDAIDSRVMGDYIEKSANNFVREFSSAIDASKNELRRNPIPFLTNPKFKEGAPKEVIDKANEVANSISYFIGVPTKTSRNVQTLKEKILQSALNSFDRNGSAFKIVEENLLHTVKDPSTYFRSLAFHTKMGLFNPKQIFLQSQIWTQVASIGGVKNAMMGAVAYPYTYGLSLTANVKMLDDAAKRLTKFGWKKDEFIESTKALSESGWDIVGGSTAWRDLYEGPSLISSPWGKFLDNGTYFFKKGEHYGRTVAWHSSYLEWRKANPYKALDREAIRQIRMRASDMTANMTRDMNATWQRGFAAVPTQFFGFQARVFEQLISPASRLTSKERIKLFAGISTMYGVPVGLGAVTMWPVNESVKKYMMETGIDKEADDNVFLEAIRDGVLSTAIDVMTGMDFDTAPYGPSGNPFLKDVTRGDKTWYEVFGGASAGILADMVGPVFKGVYRMVTDGPSSDDPFYIDKELMFDLINQSQVSSLKNSVKLWKALNTGKWISGNDTILGDISTTEAWISAVTGLEIEDVTDTFLQLETNKDIKDYLNSLETDVRKEYSKARRALDMGDSEAYAYHTKKAKAMAIQGGMDPRKQYKAFSDGFYPQDLEEAAKERMQTYVMDYYKRKNKGKQ